MKKFLAIILFFIFISFGALAIAQPPPNPGQGNPPPHAVPIGGIEILLLGGLALGGIKKLINKKDKA